MQWLRLYDDVLDDPKVQQLTAKEFKRLFYDAVSTNSEPGNPFLDFIEGPFGSANDRPAIAEWRVIRDRIFERDDYTCVYCGLRGGRMECDHIVPVSRGGSHEDSNLVTSCRSCNRAKFTKLIEEWR